MKAILLSVAVALTVAAQADGYDSSSWKVRQSRMVLRTAEIAVSGEKIRIEVFTEPENQSWGRELADWTTRIMPIFYTRFGKPSGNLLIQIIEDPELPSGGIADVNLLR
jgi:hypothetical protein